MRTHPGISRFTDRLPELNGIPLVTLGEGNTPLVPLKRIGEKIGLPRLYGKLEGCNPTGSYKDRIAAVSMTLAVSSGKRGWVTTSSGNAGASLGAYGARADLPGIAFVVSTIPREKLVPVQNFVDKVTAVEDVGTNGDRNDALLMFEAVEAAAEEHNLFLGVTAHAYNPAGMRGADTISYELLEDSPAPDFCYVPTGGGGLASAIARGFHDSGANTRVVVAQPRGCSPIVSVLRGDLEKPSIAQCLTEVSGLQLPSPPDGDLAVRMIHESAGWGTYVADTEIYASQSELARTEGVFVEPAGATALAAAAFDRQKGRLPEDAKVVLVLTSTGLKDLATTERELVSLKKVSAREVEDAVGEWITDVVGRPRR